MKTVYACIICYSFLCAACSDEINKRVELQIISKSENSPLVIDAQSTHDSVEISDLITTIEVVPLKTKDSLYLTGLNKLVPFDDKFLLCDYKLASLILFDKNGNELRKIGGLGSGAGEYLSIEEFCIDYESNQILVYSNEKMALLKYGFDGTFMEEYALGFYGADFAILDSQHLVFYLNQNTGKVSGKHNLLITDKKGNVLQRLFPIATLPHKGFSFTGFLQESDSSILFAEPFCDSVYQIKKDKYGLKYEVAFGARTFPFSLKKDSAQLVNNVLNYNWIENKVVDSKNYLYLRYNEDRNVKHLIFNKNANRAVRANFAKDGLGEFFLYNTIGCDADMFYSIYDPEMLKSVANKNPDFKKSLAHLDPKLHSIVVNSLSLGNPMLFKFSFKF